MSLRYMLNIADSIRCPHVGSSCMLSPHTWPAPMAGACARGAAHAVACTLLEAYLRHAGRWRGLRHGQAPEQSLPPAGWRAECGAVGGEIHGASHLRRTCARTQQAQRVPWLCALAAVRSCFCQRHGDGGASSRQACQVHTMWARTRGPRTQSSKASCVSTRALRRFSTATAHPCCRHPA